MDKVYRVEDSVGMGPYTSEIYFGYVRKYNSYDRPEWCAMLAEHQASTRHPGPFRDWSDFSSTFGGFNGITAFLFGCPTPNALVGWFSRLEDLTLAGFKIVEVTVPKRYDSRSGYQTAYPRDSVDSKRELSYKELREMLTG